MTKEGRNAHARAMFLDKDYDLMSTMVHSFFQICAVRTKAYDEDVGQNEVMFSA